MLYHLLYISEESSFFDQQRDMEDILKTSQKNNVSAQLTGILIKNDKFFIQLLEGDSKSVEKMYTKISKDRRHKSIRKLLEYKSKERIFPRWSMGYVNLDSKNDNEIKLKEIIPFIHKDIIKLKSSKEKILSILKNFNSAS
ncbi:MAG: bluf domain protein [Halobacteriovoraceae bacterium]|nr:bluf domain protein [Halobacteriovoraceae bacterium]